MASGKVTAARVQRSREGPIDADVVIRATAFDDVAAAFRLHSTLYTIFVLYQLTKLFVEKYVIKKSQN